MIYLKKERERGGKREERESECVSEGVSERERENKREKKDWEEFTNSLDIHYPYTKSCLFIHSLQLYLEYILYSFMINLKKERERAGKRGE